MLRTALVAGTALGVGFLAGNVTGFRAAVGDFVENDGQRLQEMAAMMYSPQELLGGMNGSEEREVIDTEDINNLVEEFEQAFEQGMQDSDEERGNGPAFQ